MEIVYSGHARNQMRLRLKKGVTYGDVEAAIRQPDRTEPTYEERTNAFRRLPDGRILQVTWIEEAGSIIEILDASQRLGTEAVARIAIEGIPSVAAALVDEGEDQSESPAAVVDAAPRG